MKTAIISLLAMFGVIIGFIFLKAKVTFSITYLTILIGIICLAWASGYLDGSLRERISEQFSKLRNEYNQGRTENIINRQLSH